MKWIKPNGQEIETNDRPETIEHCESIGWKEAKKPAKKKPDQLTDTELDALTDPGTG
jgi:hypothetical protein